MQESPGNAQILDHPTEVVESITRIWDTLTPSEKYWVDYRACNGVRFTEDGTVERMTVDDCAAYLKVDDSTLRRWEKRIPRFAELKAMRRKELYGDKIVDKTWSAAAIRAALGELGHIELILTNFDPNYKSPKQTHELEIGDNIAEIFGLMRKEAQIIDGELVPDTGTEAMASPELPANIPSQS